MLIGIIFFLMKELGFLDYFLQLIINELNLFFRGFQIFLVNKDLVFVKVLLLCVFFDILVVCKFVGFMGYVVIKVFFLCIIFFQDNFGNRYCRLVDNNKW